MATDKQDNIALKSQKHLDDRYYKPGNTAYASKQEAFNLITYKVKKLTFAVLINGVETECWFKDATGSVNDIVEKTTATPDDATHRLVTDEQINVWNNKQPGGDYASNFALNQGLSAANSAIGSKASKVGEEDIEIIDFTKGPILKSPNGTRARLTLNDDLTLTLTSL